MSNEMIPVATSYAQRLIAGSRPVQSYVRVYSGDWEPLCDVDISSGERLSVQWPCRLEFVSLSGGLAHG
jgi:hypothetical protein